jgi:hypothetical protein
MPTINYNNKNSNRNWLRTMGKAHPCEDAQPNACVFPYTRRVDCSIHTSACRCGWEEPLVTCGRGWLRRRTMVTKKNRCEGIADIASMVAEKDDGDDIASILSVSEYADSRLADIASDMRDHLDVVLSDQEWQRRHKKRLNQVLHVKATQWYLPLVDLRKQLGVVGNVPLTPNAYDRTKSKRTWEKETMRWRHSVNGTACCFAAWTYSVRTPKQSAQACGLGGG